MKQIKIYGKLYVAALMSLLLLVSCGGGGGNDSGGGGGGNPGGGGSYTPKFYYQTVTVSAQGGTQSVTLNDLSSAVSTVGTTPSWVVISPQFYSSGAPSIKLEIEENKDTKERECNTTILAASGDKVSLTIKQQAGSVPDTPKTGIDDPHNDQTDQPAYAPRR